MAERAGPDRDRQQQLDYWRGSIDAKLLTIDISIQRLDKTMDAVKADIVASNLTMARYVGGVGLLIALVTVLAPFVLKWLFGVKP